MNFTVTVGFILICATAASARVCDACNVITMLIIVTLVSLATKQAREITVNY